MTCPPGIHLLRHRFSIRMFIDWVIEKEALSPRCKRLHSISFSLNSFEDKFRPQVNSTKNLLAFFSLPYLKTYLKKQ